MTQEFTKQSSLKIVRSYPEHPVESGIVEWDQRIRIPPLASMISPVMKLP